MKTANGSLESRQVLGTTILLVIGLVFIATNLFFTEVVFENGAPQFPSFHLFGAILLMGIILSQPCILVVWFCLSPDTLPKRCVVFCLGSIILLSAWMIGELFALQPRGSIGRQLMNGGFWLVCYVPVLTLGLGCPLFLARQLFGLQLTSAQHKSGQQPKQFTITQLLWTTAIVALFLACAQIPTILDVSDRTQDAIATGVLFGIGFGFGLFILLPMTLLTMREKGFGFWFFGAPVYAVAVFLIPATLVFLFNRGRGPGELAAYICATSLVAASAISITCFLTGLRRLGFRVARSR